MKRGPIVAMILLTGLGFWLVYQPQRQAAREGSFLQPATIVGERGYVEYDPEPAPGQGSFRVVYRDGAVGRWMSEAEFREIFGDQVADRMLAGGSNALFRLLNVTNWFGILWVGLGFGAQAMFAGRMFLQWIVSEKARESIVPTAFWWLSLIGGACLFTYFVWRKDVVGVLGQSTGIVIYARNLRLIHKQKVRLAAAESPA